MGGIFKPSVPDNSAQVAEMRKQEEQAAARAKEDKKRLNSELLSLRQRRFGRQSLIRNQGGELGVNSMLGQTTTPDGGNV